MFYQVFFFAISYSLYSECILKQDAAKSSGIELLLNILQSQLQKRDASMALSILASRANFISSLLKAISPSPTSQVFSFTLFTLNHFSYLRLIALFKLV